MEPLLGQDGAVRYEVERIVMHRCHRGVEELFVLEGLTAPVSLRQCAVAEGGVSRLQGMPGIPCSDMPVI